jgi:hypothetical protein
MPAKLNDESLRPPLVGVIKCDDTVGLPGKEVLLFERDGVSPAAASVRRNSTHSLENDYKFPNQYISWGKKVFHTSVSSDFSNSPAFAGEPDADTERLQNDDGGGEVMFGFRDEPERCRPAFSRSCSVQERMELSRESISKRFPSARGVLRKERRTFVTSRLSTLVSVELRRRRRRASIRCSLSITAVTEALERSACGNGDSTFMS